ncbi:MAG TPA: tetratricopeptide repeat protein, partial [Chthoniobacterales bacterium]
MRWLAPWCVLGILSPAFAQEIRRATPVESPSPNPVDRIQNPSWMQMLPPRTATPAPAPAEPMVRPALPVEPVPPRVNQPAGQEAPPIRPALPAGTPYRPAARAVPVEAAPTPAPSPTPIPTPTPDPGNAIRITAGETPADPAQAALQRADSFYSRKLYDLAIPDYEAYLRLSRPKSKGRDAALFRLAECQRFLERGDAAQAIYERLLDEFSQGEFASSGAYRLGEIFFGKGVYALAAPQFEKAGQTTPHEAVRLSADFYFARSLEEMREDARALAAYEKVRQSPVKENPYRDYAQTAAARLAAKVGDKKRAAELFTAISQTGGSEELKAEAAVKAAGLWLELGDGKPARQLLDQVIKNGKSAKWAGVAQTTLADLDYQAGDYARLAQLADKLDTMPAEVQPRILLVAANSRRQLSQHTKALELYDRLMREFPNSPEVQSARFQRLVSLYETGNPGLAEELNQFLFATYDPKERNQATMLKAEMLFKAGRYAEAASAYQPLPDADLPDNLKAESLYKLA